MNRKRTQDLDTTGNSTPIFCETPARHSEYKVDNVLDRVFTASNNKIEHEIEVDIKCDSGLVEMTDGETVDFSQFVIDDIRSASCCRSHSCLFDNPPSSFVSTINSYHATAPGLLPSNTANDFKKSSQIVTPRLYTSKGTEGSQNISGDQQHGQRGVPDAPRQICSEPREAEWPPSSFMVPQQTPSQTSTNFKSHSSFSPADPSAELLEGAPLLDEPGQHISTSKRQAKTALTLVGFRYLLLRRGEDRERLGVVPRKKWLLSATIS
jgi:hypothetical protein